MLLTSREMAEHLIHHIAKEDEVLYPMALRFIPEGEMDRLAVDFDEADRPQPTQDAHAALRALAGSLLKTFPPRAA